MSESAPNRHYTQQVFDAVLAEICEADQVDAAIIANQEGFLIAAATTVSTAETLAAMVAYLSHAVQRVQSQLELAPIDEVTIRDSDQRLLVYRSVAVSEHEQVLLVLLLSSRKAYRRLTNVAMRRIQDAWHLED
ncbi:MAG: roadblock/LC7 domain-containing protein [Chloroflexi bacterium]|nr:roadblock/LC7 domain-containing protein [Chloroflexota bacterium]MBU1746850.1 roadblock/LC7 domain-containing protein [Chloroflexota bacterium]MBU1879632.1 roadblock/LC7 domain-containing protein [Chloroflexota bacterium]